MGGYGDDVSNDFREKSKTNILNKARLARYEKVVKRRNIHVLNTCKELRRKCAHNCVEKAHNITAEIDSQPASP